MGGATFTPNLYDWRWYQDDAANPVTPYANLNTTYSGTDASTTIFRLRWNVRDSGRKSANNIATSFQYSTDQTNWNTIGTTAAWNFANGQGTNGTILSTNLLASSTASAEYCETAGNSQTFAASAITETDLAISPALSWSSGTTYYFRLVLAGAAVPLDSGKSYPSITLTQSTPQGRVWGAIMKYYNGSQWVECTSTMVHIYTGGSFKECPSSNIKIYRNDNDGITTAGWYPVRFNG